MEKSSQTHRSFDKIIEEQIKKWQVTQRKKYKNPIRPVITMSRLPGAGGNCLAQRLADSLKIDLFDHEIVEKIATNSKVSRQIVESLDEQDRSVFEEWINALGEDHMWSYEYLQHLTNVVGAIGTHGHAIIVGRGASFILPREVSLRLLVTAPLDVRVRNVARIFNVPEKEARRRVMRTEADRRAFIRKYFQADLTDPNNFDLVINTENTDLSLAARIVEETFNSRQWFQYKP
jgi:cytidylate kinase